MVFPLGVATNVAPLLGADDPVVPDFPIDPKLDPRGDWLGCPATITAPMLTTASPIGNI